MMLFSRQLDRVRIELFQQNELREPNESNGAKEVLENTKNLENIREQVDSKKISVKERKRRSIAARLITLNLAIVFSAVGFLSSELTHAGDPMAPPGLGPKPKAKSKSKSNASRPEFRLAQILYSEQRKVAVINNRIVKVGDIIRGAKVTEIGPKKVTLKRKGKTLSLMIDRYLIKSKKE